MLSILALSGITGQKGDLKIIGKESGMNLFFHTVRSPILPFDDSMYTVARMNLLA